MREFNFEEERN
jgi:hypothetical protein